MSVLLFFVDGLGLGTNDLQTNPFCQAKLSRTTELLGKKWVFSQDEPIFADNATMIPTDAGMGVFGRPQSATGQAAILTGRNIPSLVGTHYGPKPNQAIAELICQGTIFHHVAKARKSSALLTPYPQRYFDAIASGRRSYSTVPLAAADAGIPLLTADDLKAGDAVSPDFTGQGWHDHLGYDDIPTISLEDAGGRIAQLGKRHDFAFFEHWLSDYIGHRGTMAEATRHLERLDTVIGGIVDNWREEDGLLIICSDHGNLEDKSDRRHTTNPTPTILVGANHANLGARIESLADIAGIVQETLQLKNNQWLNN